jgi:hypothetical protein
VVDACPGMAEQRCPGLGSPEWTALPGTALELIVKALPAKGGCLRTSRKLRDAVLSASRSISLTILGNEPSQAEHHPLLRRACSTAAPGLKLVLHGDKCAWKRTTRVLAELLQPFTLEGSKLANVHQLGLKVCLGCKELLGMQQPCGQCIGSLRQCVAIVWLSTTPGS